MDRPSITSQMDLLVNTLLDGDQTRAISVARDLMAAGVENKQIIIEGVEAAMAQLDARCTVEQFNLLEIMLCGRAVTGVMKELYPPEVPPPVFKATIVIGALEGDVHDVGKNIFKMILTVSGYRVVDCGKDCPTARLLEVAERENALAVGISGLITTVIPRILKVKAMATARGLTALKVMAGGAALKQSTAADLNVDFVGQNAFEGVHYLDQLTGGQR